MIVLPTRVLNPVVVLIETEVDEVDSVADVAEIVALIADRAAGPAAEVVSRATDN